MRGHEWDKYSETTRNSGQCKSEEYIEDQNRKYSSYSFDECG